jgi:hypothetical protein
MKMPALQVKGVKIRVADAAAAAQVPKVAPVVVAPSPQDNLRKTGAYIHHR